MEVTKVANEYLSKDIMLKRGNKILSFVFCGNLDLYWTIHNLDSIKNAKNDFQYFLITKENYQVFSIFEDLFSDIENIDIYGDESEVSGLVENSEKDKYRKFNYSNYNELFNKEDKTITWYSDETAHDVANVLKIKKLVDSFIVEFYTQTYIEGYNRDFYSAFNINIRFRNSGSRYKPFNIVFMRMFDNLQKIDDINDYHQVLLEEYLYNLKKPKIGIISNGRIPSSLLKEECLMENIELPQVQSSVPFKKIELIKKL